MFAVSATMKLNTCVALEIVCLLRYYQNPQKYFLLIVLDMH